MVAPALVRPVLRPCCPHLAARRPHSSLFVFLLGSLPLTVPLPLPPLPPRRQGGRCQPQVRGGCPSRRTNLCAWSAGMLARRRAGRSRGRVSGARETRQVGDAERSGAVAVRAGAVQRDWGGCVRLRSDALSLLCTLLPICPTNTLSSPLSLGPATGAVSPEEPSLAPKPGSGRGRPTAAGCTSALAASWWGGPRCSAWSTASRW